MNYLKTWLTSAHIWEAVKFLVPTIISVAALIFVIKDRKPRLRLRQREGKWRVLKSSDSGVIFQGIIEIYNLSTRPNSVLNYHFWGKEGDGSWRRLESEHYTNTEAGEGDLVFNPTPLVLAPHSGTEARVQAFTGLSRRPYEMAIKIEVEDLFHKHYDVEVVATP